MCIIRSCGRFYRHCKHNRSNSHGAFCGHFHDGIFRFFYLLYKITNTSSYFTVQIDSNAKTELDRACQWVRVLLPSCAPIPRHFLRPRPAPAADSTDRHQQGVCSTRGRCGNTFLRADFPCRAGRKRWRARASPTTLLRQQQIATTIAALPRMIFSIPPPQTLWNWRSRMENFERVKLSNVQ